MKLNLSPRDRRAMVLGLVALGAIAVARFALIPFVDSWLAARDQLRADRQAAGEVQVRLARAIGQQGRLANRYGPAVGKGLQDVESARMSLFSAVQQVTTSSGLKPEVYQPLPDRAIRELPGVRLVPLEVRGKCQADQVVACLAALARSDTLLLVDRLAVTGDDKGSGQVEVTMVLATLARGSAAATAAPQALPEVLP